MREKELQDYLYEHPELLFPGCRVQEKAREYAIHGKRIDLLFVVDGVRYIVELKAVALQRDHIGQVVEYYGLMKKYLQEANLRMILVAPSIPEWRGKYLEELGIRCVELPEVPQNPDSVKPVADLSRKKMRAEEEELKWDSLLRSEERLEWEEAIGPGTRRTVAFAHRFLRDSLEQVRTKFSEYEITPHRIKRAPSPTVFVNYGEVAGNGPLKFSHGSLWWAYSFGHSENTPPAEDPNISIWTSICGIEVSVDAEIRPAQQVLKQRISSDPGRFNRIIRELGEGLTLTLYLKYEHRPRFYHWVTCLKKRSGEFDAATVLGAYDDHGKRFKEERDYWIGRIIRENGNLSDRQRSHLERANRSLNLATCFCIGFYEGNPFWQLPYKDQVKELSGSVIWLKPLLDFFIEDERK